MKSLKLISSAITMLVCFVTFAQKRIISGTVLDESSIPLPGVNIKAQRSENKVKTDFDGNYIIKVKKNDTLVFSYAGLKTETITTERKTNINLKMVDSVDFQIPVPCYYPIKRILKQ
ncbi:carboxypeptidase-like protein [Flavobacterium sp. 270]|uniref:carboxypeptidase-like regulatory domain-containing protein n=1 Tax=Flavobacterium sp. 270 TaxID=2512114 RepID=UPI001064BDF6|nr:carboxypeptidase-like regulatory domain-containing protein [Flavobacterium sp. 270]TDW48541.1 carboxypeptidase-like protein [Flavobacterium sp. 270]